MGNFAGIPSPFNAKFIDVCQRRGVVVYTGCQNSVTGDIWWNTPVEMTTTEEAIVKLVELKLRGYEVIERVT